MDDILNDFSVFDSIDTQIMISAKNAKVYVEKLDDKSASKFIDRVVSKYKLESAYGFAWERLCRQIANGKLECESIYGREIWDKLESMQLNNVIIFFDHFECKSAYLFSNMQDLMRTLDPCDDFEFYLTNKNLDYIIAYTHCYYLYICKYK